MDTLVSAAVVRRGLWGTERIGAEIDKPPVFQGFT